MKNVAALRILVTLLFLCCASTLVLSQRVNVDWKHGTSFASFKTYAWGQSPQPLNDSLWDQRIVDAIDRALAGKGLKKVNIVDAPDLVIIYSAGVKQEITYAGFNIDWYSPSSSTRREENERVGTLVVDVADPSRKEILWRGTVKDALADRSEKNIAKLNKMVSKMFKNFPPAS